MTKRNDISVPEGHLEALQEKLLQIPQAQQQAPKGIRRMAPYLAYAASLAALVVMGNLILRVSSPKEEDGLTREEIVSYLLADNISVEQLNALYYEEDY